MKLVEKEMNRIIRRCLWMPSGDPGPSLLRRATAAYLVLVDMGLKIDVEDEVVFCLKESKFLK